MSFIRSSSRAALLAAALAGAGSRALAGQSARAARDLSLDAVVAAAADSAPSVQRREASADAARGGFLLARAAYAPNVTFGVSQHRQPGPATDGTPASPITSASYDITAAKIFSSGLVMQPSVHMTRSPIPGVEPYGGTAGAAFSLPLSRNRFGAATRANERSADDAYTAARLEVGSTRATAARDAALTFWNLWSAEQSLEVYRAAEARADRTAANLRTLVAAGERATTDLQQAEATVFSRRSARIAAEQSVVVARRALADLLGWSADDLAQVGSAAARDPEPVEYSPTAHDAQALVAFALGHRHDLQSLDRSVLSAQSAAAAAHADARTQLDLVASLNVAGLKANGVGGFAQAAASRLTGTTAVASLGLQYALPTSTIGREGVDVAARAAVTDIKVTRGALARTIELAVNTAIGSVQRSGASLRQSRDAAALYRTGVANEQKKYEAEASTIFEVLLAEDRLTSAEIDRVAREAAYAQAVITLRYESATLLDATGHVVSLESLTTPPFSGGGSLSPAAPPAREDR